MKENSHKDQLGYPAILHGPEGGSGKTCRAIPRSSGIDAEIDGKVVAQFDYRSIKASLAGVDDRYICFEVLSGGKTAKLLVPDREFVSHIEAAGASGQLLEQLRQLGRQRMGRRLGRSSVLVGLVVVIAVGAALLWFGFDWVIDRAVGMIPEEWETKLGKAAAAETLSKNQVCADAELQRVTQELGTRLVGAIESSPYSFRLRVIDSEDVNAFALPGGYIFLNRGLIQESKDSNEIAGVLAHEIQHVLRRHGLRNVVRQAGLMMLLMAVIGDVSGLEQFLLVQAADLATMSFSRDQEREADLGAVGLLRRARLDPLGLPRFLNRLATKEGALSGLMTMISTHPPSKERVQELNALISSMQPGEIQQLSFSWEKIEDRCSPVSTTNPDAPLFSY